MKYFAPDFLQFFKELAANNNKEWFDANRKRYETTVKKPMEVFVGDALKELYKDKKLEVKPSECIFRINRDIRFAKDKAPYKLFTSAVISAEGKSTHGTGGIYVELGPEKLAFAGGAYQPEKDALLDIREAIAKNPKALMKAVKDKSFAKHWGDIQGERNKVLPAEFKEVVEECPYIANKQLYYWVELDSKIITSDKLMKTVVDYYTAATPVREFLEKAVRR